MIYSTDILDAKNILNNIYKTLINEGGVKVNPKLIEIQKVIKVCELLVCKIEQVGDVSTDDETYKEYQKLVLDFCRKYEIKKNKTGNYRNIYNIIDKYYWSGNRASSVNIGEAKIIYEAVTKLKYEMFPNVYEKIFISHREVDKKQVAAFMDLLYAIGIPRPSTGEESTIFCSSHPAAYIENGKMIDEEIIKQFYDHRNTLFILWYTDNYFESQACLNEMGAIWVMKKEYQEILAPNFDRNKVGGLLPPMKMNFYADDKYRLNILKEQLEKMFYLKPISINLWESEREKFINRINENALIDGC